MDQISLKVSVFIVSTVNVCFHMHGFMCIRKVIKEQSFSNILYSINLTHKIIESPLLAWLVGISLMAHLGPISQRDLSPDFCQQNVKYLVLDLVDPTKQLSP